MQDRLSTTLQENLLLILCFDNEHSSIVRNSIEPELFEGDYYHIAVRSYEFIDKYKCAPGDHIADIFDDILEGKNERRAKVFKSILQYLYNNREQVNAEYAMARLSKFIRQQTLKKGILDAADLLHKGTDDSLDQAEVILNRTLIQRAIGFDAGVRLSDLARSLGFLKTKEEAFLTGIHEFDIYGLGPARKELHLFLALMKRGKSWWLLNLARKSLQQNLNVCHITLEMSEDKMCQRYFQNLFSIPKRRGRYSHYEFEVDDLRRMVGLNEVSVDRRVSLEDPKIRDYLKDKVGHFGAKLNRLVIKSFPTSTLTVPQLRAYLDLLEQTEHFIPDLLIIDYIELMKINPERYRFDVGNLYKELRGIAGERNIAVATASQSNREGMDAKIINEGNLAEDFSKGMTVDCMISYNQTDAEKERGLARLFVALARNDIDRFTVLISQDYNLGQFVFDSTLMTSNYENILASDS